MISVKDLRKSYRQHDVLKGLDFHVARGSIFALLGENGAGKTTTVKILSTLIRADKGTVMIGKHDLARDAAFIRKMISVTGQYSAVDELLTGEENLHMMGCLTHLRRREVKKRTAELLREFDLVEAAKKRVKTYSGGMRRRLDIAASLLGSPQIIFLDEPTTGLDPRSRMNMWRFIKQLANDGVTIFLTTQYLEEADQLADKVAVINDGKIVAEGSADELKRLVGDEKLEITFDNHADFQIAVNLLNGHPEEDKQMITVSTNGSIETLRQLLNDLHEQGIEPNNVQLRKPTLDDVFMENTNRSTKGASVQ
ncbi:ATP-binding cassette domain-containing protein [Evansella halocellulosilytica]|uniref:ATP-binding cassette domain-containing protein n=1 Tax=Evansella halocellulosilytica TaxID=2011013 RepID=UPI000BB976FE|nr:ATP-binding cassette domain-containing protein [Evansella halocellulosilytica]